MKNQTERKKRKSKYEDVAESIHMQYQDKNPEVVCPRINCFIDK